MSPSCARAGISRLLSLGHEHPDGSREHYYGRNPPQYVRADAIHYSHLKFTIDGLTGYNMSSS